ncbi:leucine--tRNA ligase [Hymenobacter rubripertinctus]|uniref:Leucine--tRNA ligase n=1 Tax=Hymenobacter rubripertinctus TaxID=2029981 RepID=A0A418QTT1_9BACT|nr:class I tRNA ligase family protein [Hymenobacter rubripertinctus]RIY08646.1 leucine--tRNA ligase [Hymenobacter rubripertinctus]
MPGYHPQDIEKKWQAHWKDHHTFRADNAADKPKYYALDMFPYPSGAGLHVGHPLGYIASDIVARYKRLRGFNVLHPMGFDSFGLPAEQYAIQTGQHPAITTEQNISTYIRQLSALGFSYDWSREIRTSDPAYYKWTQWIFLKLFNSWYNLDTDRAEPLKTLLDKFASNGSAGIRAAGDTDERHDFTAGQWQGFSEKQRLQAVHPYRLAYQQDTYVNWCPGLGTVLSNDEVKDGLSERGGFPVERRLMPQWNLRITAYADRLLRGLDALDWPDAVKEMQRNWIGKSIGASVRFPVYLRTADGDMKPQPEEIEVFTTRVDTIFGATFLVLAPELDLTLNLGERAAAQADYSPEASQTYSELQAYVKTATNRSERERQTDVKSVSGAPTGSYVQNPFTLEFLPVWTADYVLAGYGTGAVMGVPSGDQRDWLFATHFALPIRQILDGQQHLDQQADPTKEGRYVNSGFITGLTYDEATEQLRLRLRANRVGEPKITYRIRDAIFGRQRYWGEPIPIYYKDGVAYGVAEADLPLVLPEIDEYKPTETGEPPLARAQDWLYKGKYPYELSTMPGWAGSSWYYLRYMDPHNADRFVGEEAEAYWQNVDLYLGGAEHATGHLLYSRFWHLFLKDLGLVTTPEPFQKLINQGMILGRSNFVYRLNNHWLSRDRANDSYRIVSNDEANLPVIFVSKSFYDAMTQQIDNPEQHPILPRFFQQLSEIENRVRQQYPDLDLQTDPVTAPVDSYASISALHTDVNIVENEVLDVEAFKNWREEYVNAEFILEENGTYICGTEVEKMSKSKYNVVNPDTLIERYGADALRLYEMFLGPLEQFKPWNTNGMSGVAGFLKKFWRLYHPQDGTFAVTEEPAAPAELKALHKAIRKVEEDIERFSFNTTVSALMITVNELTALECHKRAILEPLVVLLSPYAPHLAEELWLQLGHAPGSISTAAYPEFREEFLVEDVVNYPVAINGKVREQLQFPATATPQEIEAAVRATDVLERFAEGKPAKKVIVVPGRMVNIVV